MVLEAVIETLIDNCTVQEVFSVLHEKPDATVAFHESLGSEIVSISSWNDGQRVVTYLLKMKMPAIVKSFVGSDTLGMVETQSLERWEFDSGYTVVCMPAAQITGSNRFSTPATFEVAQSGADVRITCRVKCTAAVWGMMGVIEPMMLKEATSALRKQLDFFVVYFNLHRACTQHIGKAGDSPIVQEAEPAVLPRPLVSMTSSSSLADLDSVFGRSSPVPAECSLPGAADDLYFDAFEPLDAKEVMCQLKELHRQAQDNQNVRVHDAALVLALSQRVDCLQAAIERLEKAQTLQASSFGASSTLLSATFIGGVLAGVCAATILLSAVDHRSRRM